MALANLLQGDLPKNKLKLVWAWIEQHREELIANWDLAINGQKLFYKTAVVMKRIISVKALKNYMLQIEFE